MASYSPGIPHNIKDSVLSVYNRLEEEAKNVMATIVDSFLKDWKSSGFIKLTIVA
jgi:hypothetical protein